MTQPLLSVVASDSVWPEVHHAIGVVVGWQARDGTEIDWTLFKHWRHFRAQPGFWSDQGSISRRE
jgi:hypothetical protein